MSLQAAVPAVAIIGCVFCGILALIHIYIFILEAILWRKRAANAFGFSQSTVDTGTVLAANQGFYNLLIAVGLIWGLAELNGYILLYFLAAICTAGLFGTITASVRILFVQVIPSFVGFVLIDFGFISIRDWLYWRHPVYVLIIFLGACILTILIAVLIKKLFLNKTSSPSIKPGQYSDDI
jgi:putative membrane protein